MYVFIGDVIIIGHVKHKIFSVIVKRESDAFTKSLLYFTYMYS